MATARSAKNPSSTGRRPPRRRLVPDVRRSELLEAALEVLKDMGPAEARVEDVTSRAGAAKGTFYLYFPSWSDLLLAVRDHLVSTYGAQVRSRLASIPSLTWPVFEDECARFIDYVVELGDLHLTIFHGPTVPTSADKELSASGLIEEIIRAGIATGVCRPVSAEIAAPLLFSVLHATADSIAQAGDREAKLNTALELLRAWLRA